jgi:hypothetical protein
MNFGFSKRNMTDKHGESDIFRHQQDNQSYQNPNMYIYDVIQPPRAKQHCSKSGQIASQSK